MLLRNKTAVIYGTGGVGSAVSHAFVREGARVFLASRSDESGLKVVQEIQAQGGNAEFAQIDALDAIAVQRHFDDVVAVAGGVDISFNAISLGDAQGAALVALTEEAFNTPIKAAMKSHFLTATTAAAHMSARGSGVILALTAQAGRKPYPNVGGFGVACAAIEALVRQLAVELGPRGIRVACIRSAGSPDTPGLRDTWRAHARNAGIPPDAFEAGIADRTMLKRLPMLSEVANIAAVMASDFASCMTATIANATCGEIAD